MNKNLIAEASISEFRCGWRHLCGRQAKDANGITEMLTGTERIFKNFYLISHLNSTVLLAQSSRSLFSVYSCTS